MATFTVDCTAKVINNFVHLVAERGDRVITAILSESEVIDPNDFANWVLARAGDTVNTSGVQRRYTITAHQETVPDPDGGGDLLVWVVDEVLFNPLPQDTARAGFASLPGWASWTAAEAAAWIDTNVTDLASAKVVLSAMAQAIVYLRDWRSVNSLP